MMVGADADLTLDERLDQAYTKIEKKNTIEQIFLYKYLIKEVNNKMNSENRESISYLNAWLYSKLKKLQPVEKKSTQIWAHTSVTLYFDEVSDLQGTLASKVELIRNSQSVFIFRSTNFNLSRLRMQNIVTEIKNINPKVLIFTDQEGWMVNRYKDFDTWYSMEQFLQNTYVFTKLSEVNSQDAQIIENYLSLSRENYPSLYNISLIYDSIQDETSKQIFLDIMAFIRLETLKQTWINTYWLVADLNYWNPAISSIQRSFSKFTVKYEKLVDAFIKASDETWVIVYLKHFPGHWAWTTDSHAWVLDYTSLWEYTVENMKIFRYFLENSNQIAWLMTWHIVFDLQQKTQFESIVSQADFVITDSLSMKWYTSMCSSGNSTANCYKTESAFSTDLVMTHSNLIKLDAGLQTSAQ